MSPVRRYGVPGRCQALSFKTLAVLVLAAAACARHDAPPNDWRVTGGEPGNARYSLLDQINRGNVGRLRVAWTYHTGDIPAGGHSEIQATPIVVDGTSHLELRRFRLTRSGCGAQPEHIR